MNKGQDIHVRLNALQEDVFHLARQIKNVLETVARNDAARADGDIELLSRFEVIEAMFDALIATHPAPLAVKRAFQTKLSQHQIGFLDAAEEDLPAEQARKVNVPINEMAQRWLAQLFPPQ